MITRQERGLERTIEDITTLTARAAEVREAAERQSQELQEELRWLRGE